jgi:hypothetical protein
MNSEQLAVAMLAPAKAGTPNLSPRGTVICFSSALGCFANFRF